MGEHAIVIGASLAGLCAARVLSDFYDRVTIYERDELPDGPDNRTAVPQGRHVHLLMARGAGGIRRTVSRPARRHGGRGRAEAGEPAGLHPLRRRRARAGHQHHAQAGVHRLRAEPTAPGMADPRTRAGHPERRPGRTPASPSLRYDAREQRVTGVLLDAGDQSSAVAADLVVDATGRGTRLPVWLEQWGFGRPTEDTVDVGIDYATHRVRIPDGAHRGEGGGRRRIPRAARRPRHAAATRTATGSVTTFGTGKVDAAAELRRDLRRGRRAAAATRQRRAPRRGTRGRHGLSQVPREQVAPLRPDGPLSHRHHPVRRRRRELQPDLRPGHDDDVDPGGQPAGGAASPGRPTSPASCRARRRRPRGRCGR